MTKREDVRRRDLKNKSGRHKKLKKASGLYAGGVVK